ncbi:MAG: M48 family metallopeptidase [Planctomycetota bacterium]
MRNPARLPLRFLSLLSLLATASCGNLNIYSDEELEPLSVQAYDQASQEHPVTTTHKDWAMVQDCAQRITAACDVDFPWEVRLLDAPQTPNAFCLPNGRIAIYTGILPITQNADGLAAVMGHEVAHATLRHGGKRMTQGALSNSAMSIVQGGLGMTEWTDGAKGTIMTVLGMGAQYGVMLPYSRDHETEADIEGIRYAIRAGFDPWEAPKLWERMAELGSGGPEFMSTHPDPLARAARLREVIPQILEEERNRTPRKKVNPGAIGR